MAPVDVKNTGDGAGILLQVPDRFLRRVCAERNIELPPEKHYGVGMVFLPPDISQRRAIEDICRQMIQAEGQKFLGFRKVPTDNESLGRPPGLKSRLSSSFCRSR